MFKITKCALFMGAFSLVACSSGVVNIPLTDGGELDGATPADAHVADGSHDDAGLDASHDAGGSDAGLDAAIDAAIDASHDASMHDAATADASDDAGASACAQDTINLGGAATFAVLAGSTVTNTGATSITGDVGISPGSDLVGFPPAIVVGVEHVTDGPAATGIADLTTAYNDAAGRVLCPILVNGNLGGQTLTPGPYKSTSGLEISAGDLTLDARGDSNAIFIFQIATTLMTTSGRQVVLIGNANPANVFWQVGTSASLGTTSAFVGTIMADQAISLETGASLNGRALARIAAVTLAASTVVIPSL